MTPWPCPLVRPMIGFLTHSRTSLVTQFAYAGGIEFQRRTSGRFNPAIFGVVMQAGVLSARQARARHRHELRVLTYVSLDQANGGVIRNLTHDGIAMQAVAPVQQGQQ